MSTGSDPNVALLRKAGFPAAEAWLAVAERMGTHSQERTDDLWIQWVGGWNGLLYRFLGTHAEAEALRASLGEPGGDAPPPPQRAQQEHALYSFYTSGLSAIETIAYGVFALANWLEPRGFRFATHKERARVGVRSLARDLGKHFPGEPITQEVSSTAASAEFERWARTRNVLAHRAAPGRIISGGGDRMSAGWMGGTLDVPRIDRDEAWLAGTLGQLVEATESFCSARFS